ncbi:MAG: hypothetical protein M1821_000732 [Bathelium mastoideum]|nr:MAG: hypothetical protein M1821_000732 [Bathelium mastoideum]
MAAKVLLITGVTNGIGYETVKAFLQSPHPYHVLVCSRSPSKSSSILQKLQPEYPNTNNTVGLLQLDVTSDESIAKAFEAVKTSQGHLDILINNASKHILPSAFIFKNNHQLILPRQLNPISPSHRSPAGWPKKIDVEMIGYRCSTTAMNILMLDWGHKLKEDGIKVFSVSPGVYATGLGGLGDDALEEMGGVHPSEGAMRILAVAEGEKDDAALVVDDPGFFSIFVDFSTSWRYSSASL